MPATTGKKAHRHVRRAYLPTYKNSVDEKWVGPNHIDVKAGERGLNGHKLVAA